MHLVEIQFWHDPNHHRIEGLRNIFSFLIIIEINVDYGESFSDRLFYGNHSHISSGHSGRRGKIFIRIIRI